jgi:hypothetical protein
MLEHGRKSRGCTKTTAFQQKVDHHGKMTWLGRRNQEILESLGRSWRERNADIGRRFDFALGRAAVRIVRLTLTGRPWSRARGPASRPDLGESKALCREWLRPMPLPAPQGNAHPFRLWRSAGPPKCL